MASRAESGNQPPTPAATPPVIAQHKVSDRGTTQVASRKLQVEFAHRNTLVDVHVNDRQFQIYDNHGELLATRRTDDPSRVLRALDDDDPDDGAASALVPR